MQGWGRYARVGWGGLCRGAVGHAVHVGLITQYMTDSNSKNNNLQGFENSQMDIRGNSQMDIRGCL